MKKDGALMKSEEIINMLDEINHLIEEKEYEKAQKCIKTAKINVLSKENNLDDYIDEIVNSLC